MIGIGKLHRSNCTFMHGIMAPNCLRLEDAKSAVVVMDSVVEEHGRT